MTTVINRRKIRSEIQMLQVFKDNFMRDHKFTKSKREKVRLEKKLEKVELAIELKKASISRKRPEKNQSKPKQCLMCGNETTNPSGFCDSYAGSMFGCKETWMAEYHSKPTKKELNSKWRNIK